MKRPAISSRRAVLTGAVGTATGLAVGTAVSGPALAAAAPAIITPSGDLSGDDDYNAITAGLTSAGVAFLAPGVFYVSATIPLGLGQYLFGAGMAATMIMQPQPQPPAAPSPTVGMATITVRSSSGSNWLKAAGVFDLTVDGTNTTNGYGISFGDMSCIQLTNVAANNFGGGTGVGFYGNNTEATNGFCEQLRASIESNGCDQALVFDVLSPGGNSFERMAVDLWASPNSGGYHCIFRNGAQTLDSRLALRGNANGNTSGAGQGGAVLALSTTGSVSGSKIVNSQLDIMVENDCTSGTAAQSIYFHDTSNQVTNCYGTLDFYQPGGCLPFTESTTNGSGPGTSFSYSGRVLGDSSLQRAQTQAYWTTVTTGFVSGWSGSVSAKTNWDGDIMLVWDLAIAASTAITPGQSILKSGTTLASQFCPKVTKNLPATAITGGAVAAGTFAGLQVATNGALAFQGAAVAAQSESTYWSGLATYPLSI
jgi:hypothetical protein